MTKTNTVYVVMGSGDNGGTLPEDTIRVFDTFAGAAVYAKELRDEFYSFVSIVDRELETVQITASSLIEVANELDKGENMDIGWVKYQGNILRRTANLLSQEQ